MGHLVQNNNCKNKWFLWIILNLFLTDKDKCEKLREDLSLIVDKINVINMRIQNEN